jgi:NET1-associated nuclear protein 1 (U3 small nucleolar RNA-associated protein 17)
MADATPQLKRKREEAAAQRKAKKLRKGEAAATNDARNGVEVPSPASKSTPKPKTTPTPKNQSKPTPKTNGASEDAPINTPSTSRKNKKSDAAVNGAGDEADDKPQSTPDLLKAAERVEALEKEQAEQTPSKTEKVDASADGAMDTEDEAQDTHELSKSALKKKEKKERKERNRAERNELIKTEVPGAEKTKKSKSSEKWVTSSVQGGWFLSTDPIFSPDEKYIILANSRSLRVYSTETSLLANVLPITGTAFLTAYALSSTKPNQIYAADSKGLITLWDWVNGSKVGRWDIGAQVRNMTVITQPESDEDLVYCHEAGDTHILNIHALRTKAQASQTDLKRVLKTNSAIRDIQVLLQGKYVIVASTDSITVGKRVKVSKTALQDFEYVWREIMFSKRVTTFSAYFREPLETAKAKKAAQDQRDVLDLAVGDETGVIFLFEDILASFAAVEGSQKGKKGRSDNADTFRPKRLHWHRDAVGSVKWSLDGNYIISGGDETVLTIWQLATGQPQHLPHLSAAIENVVVSPSGSAYGLTLANNSVIVLSTTELEARTNIVGIQSRRVDNEQMPKESKTGQAKLDHFGPVPMAVNPTNPSEVLFSVPSSQPRHKNESLRPEPYLQTYDLANQRAKTRQALTRNTATEPNVAPEGGRIVEPTVTHIQLSHDGEWLATVDEWVPPRRDTGYLNEGIPEFNEEERLNRREVYLKIWRRDRDDSQWKLEARVDAPHFFENVCGNGRVFDLVSDPASAGFATVGEDHVVRIWRPKTRSRDGVVIRGAQDDGLVTWSLDRAIEISDKLDITEGSQQSLPPRTSRLAFSADGSVLAATMSWASESDAGVTHLIDANTATIRRSLTEIDVTALSGLAFVGQFLVVVADSITVWDMVSDQLSHSIPIDTPGIDRLERIPMVRLAINDTDATFAVSLPHLAKSDKPTSTLKKISSRISIFSPLQQAALWSGMSSGITLSLSSRISERGYVALDSLSCLKTFSPGATLVNLPSPPPEEVAFETEVEELEEVSTAVDMRFDDDLTQDLEDERSVFSVQDLQNLLRDGGEVLPPPQGLFSGVLRLVGGRGRVAA